MTKKIHCLILARGGSKGVPKKNIKPLLDKPLIGWIIDSAKKSKFIEDIYVSTDNEEISEISLSFGAKIIDRPSDISGDDSTDFQAFSHALNFIPNCDEIVHLRATTPTIDDLVLDDAIEFYFKNKEQCTSLRSGHEMSESIFKYLKLDNIFFSGILDSNDHSKNRQSIEKTYVPNGYIDIIKTKTILNENSLHGNKILAYITKPVIEIDTIEDFDFLEYKLKKLK